MPAAILVAATMNENSETLQVEFVGENPTRLWGLTLGERTRRLSGAAGLDWIGKTPADQGLLVNAAFACDPAWFRHVAQHPGMVLVFEGVPALANVRNRADAAQVRAAMQGGQGCAMPGMQTLEYTEGPTIEDKVLRKRETPFLTPLRPDTVRTIERASYFGAYKGVTDILTKYLWPEWALVLTRIAARIGMTPNMVTAIGAALCVVATVCFAYGWYWTGMATGLVFMVLDTVDGKLARCTVTSSWWGNIFDHGIDLVHPPFWWWFWATGLSAWGLAYDSATFWWVQGAIQIGYIVQRVIEGIFIRRHKMHIHIWRRFDSQFRLITARRNPNMVILFAATLFARPDLGLIAVAWWTVLSCLVHAVRLVQAEAAMRRTGPLVSWLAET